MATKRQEKSIKENDKGFGIKRDEKIRIRIDGNRTREEVAQDAMNLLKEL